MLKQIQILETALELHGSLAPEGVQPLHKRLLERFTQMKKSIHGMDKIKRHFSESIVNTPLPPLPIEKRSMSVSHQRPALNNNDSSDDLVDDHSNYHMMNFEKEEIYTRPSRVNGNYEARPLQAQRCVSNREPTNSIGNESSPAPPVPIRPKSAYGNYDSPEIPPKLTTSKPFSMDSAPPLPPRGVTIDKRISNPLLQCSLNYYSIDNQENDLHSASMMKSPLQKYSVVNIPFENQAEADQMKLEDSECTVEFRDSGISTTSHDLNYAYLFTDRNAGNESNQLGNGLRWQTDLNANDDENEQASNPPPIPRKMTNSVSYGMNQSNSDIFKEENFDQNIGNGDESQIDDYSMPKIVNTNNP